MERVTLRQRGGYAFDVDFGTGGTPLATDLPPPLGAGDGPSPEHLLAAAVGNCLSASLLFALRKLRQEPQPLSAEVGWTTGRNAEGRIRVTALSARLTLGVPAAQLEHLERVLGSFEAYCTVTQSVAAGIPVEVQVFDSTGQRLK